MTGTELIQKLRSCVDDQLDETLELQLINDAKDEVESLALWEQLKKEQSYTASSGLSYTTALGTLPTRFALDVKMVEAEANSEYEKVSFEDLPQKQHNPTGYFIDLNAGNIHLTGSNRSAATMKFYYTEYSADLTTSTSWVFPSRFHSILPIKAAELYYAADAGEKGRAWDDRWALQFERELARMRLWDDSLKTRNRRPNQSFGSTPKSIRR